MKVKKITKQEPYGYTRLIEQVVNNNAEVLEDALNRISKLEKAKLSALLPVKPTQRWIQIVCREATQDEKDSYFTQNGEELCFMIESEMPENGQEVLVSSNGYVSEDIFDEDYYSFENHEIVDVDAWMPLPEPYKAEREGKE